jgi:hypothetical protein
MALDRNRMADKTIVTSGLSRRHWLCSAGGGLATLGLAGALKAAERQARGPNILEIKVRKVELPKGTTARQYFAGLKKALRTQELPEGWKVDIEWRNPNTIKGRTKNWQTAEFTKALRESRKGFTTVVKKILAKHAGELPPAPAKKKAAAAPAQAELFAPSAKEKRSAASKKGWATRRAKKAAAK